MGNLKERLDRIEEKMEIGAESCILVKFPEKPGFTYGDRIFPSVEDAVEKLSKERGKPIKPHVIEVVFVDPEPENSKDDPFGRSKIETAEAETRKRSRLDSES